MKQKKLLGALALFAMPALIFSQQNVFAQTKTMDFSSFLGGTRQTYELKLVPDIALGAAGIALSVTALAIHPERKADFTVRDLNEVNVFDRWSAARYNYNLDITSTVFEFTAIFMPALLLAAPKEDWVTIGVMYAESVLLAYGAKEMAKALVFRARPYMYFEGAPRADVEIGDFAASFFSGHTTMAFNGAVFVSTVFCAYFPDSVWRIPVVAGSLSLAAATGARRIASGSHFFSDVLTGALIGCVTGFLVPFFHSVTGFPFNQPAGKKDSFSFAVIPGRISAAYWF
jgi:undecaprenyl-diphosphatase